MTTPEIQGFLLEQDDTEVSREFIPVPRLTMSRLEWLRGKPERLSRCIRSCASTHCAGQDSRRCSGAQHGRLFGAERTARWCLEYPGYVDQEHRKREV